MLTIPRRPRWLPAITVLYGVFLFFWLAPEDSLWLVAVLGWLLALIAALHLISRLAGRAFAPKHWIPGAIAAGALIGAGASFATTLLMLMKSALHQSAFSDYPLPLLVGIVERLPAWSLAGGLVGVGFVILRYRR
ncbi:MAG TPA: hypothetical protein VMT34_08395 [Aggregatilineales bacterium]|nr:hypothetical protein [Aggregatilineales bacterium]